jgi:hypothetical protein
LTDIGRQWIVCQIGARENYTIAAELHRRERLAALCTDIWCSPRTNWSWFAAIGGRNGQRIRQRFEPTLAGAHVIDERLVKILKHQLRMIAARRGKNWSHVMEGNRRFATQMAQQLITQRLFRARDGLRPAVFAYSYGAREILAAAKAAACPTVLGQIDPGPEEDALVALAARRVGLDPGAVSRPPVSYWSIWREECALADLIIANSHWSAELLVRGGAPARKLRVIPLAYNARVTAPPGLRTYPKRFTTERPLQLLFLGQATIRKGVWELVEAMQRLINAPVRLRVVGNIQAELREQCGPTPNVDWIGSVPRSETPSYYRDADLFLLPTNSDGFAITQLEALAQGTPVIATRFCGDVVRDGREGKILHDVTSEAIEATIRWALDNPETLTEMSARGPARLNNFTPARVVDELVCNLENVARG